jgi:acyl CoA:acetate/3-ketoacid CoA transferase beta subunit
LVEIDENLKVEDVQKATGCPFRVSSTLKAMGDVTKA